MPPTSRPPHASRIAGAWWARADADGVRSVAIFAKMASPARRYTYRGFERKGDRVLVYNIIVVLNQGYGLK